MRTSEVLNKAADLIEERGWVKGTNGWPGYGEGEALCLEGGIIAALGSDFLGINMTDLWACPAYQAVEAYTGTPPEDVDGHLYGRLWHWNDFSAGTAERVIETLRATAVIEAARESDMADDIIALMASPA